MDGKVRYLDNGKVMEADAAELARWYMKCLRNGSFRSKSPGVQAMADHVNFESPLHEYDDPQYFLDELVSLCTDRAEREALQNEIEEFLNG